MPAKDKYHDVVVRALQKEGWKITHEQVQLKVRGRRLFVDIEAQSAQNSIILIEVKGFENMPSPIDYLRDSVGQYVLYRAVVQWLGWDRPLYMAIPIVAYEKVFREQLGKIAITQLDLKLIVFDPQTQEIDQWIQ